MQTLEHRVIQWLFSGDTGSSSKSICAHMVGCQYEFTEPMDVSDLGRCLRLIAAFPEWAGRITEMACHGPAWSGLVNVWVDLSRSMADEVGLAWEKGSKAPLTYALMKQAIADGYRNDSRYSCVFSPEGTLISANLIEADDDDL